MNKKLIIFVLVLLAVSLTIGNFRYESTKKVNEGIKIVEATDQCSQQPCQASYTIRCSNFWGSICILTGPADCRCWTNSQGQCEEIASGIGGDLSCYQRCGSDYHLDDQWYSITQRCPQS